MADYKPTEVVDDYDDALFDDLIDTSNEGSGGDDSYMYDPIPSQYSDEEDGYEDDFGAEDEDDDKLDEGKSEEDLDTDEPTQNPSDETQIIEDILKSKGIVDSSKIRFENEKGEIEELDFYDLSYEEQLNILAGEEDDNYGLEEDEVQTVNFLRQNNITFEQAIEYYKNEAVEEYKREQRGESLQIDSLSDEEIFILDLQASYDDLEENEIIDILNHETQNEALFKRKVDKLRNEYRDAEQKQQEEADRLSKEAKNSVIKKLYEDVAEVAMTVEDIGGIDLFDEDREEVIKFITDRDINNKSSVDKALEDPKELFRIAWFLSKGDEAFDILHSYYKGEIDNVRKAATQKSKETNENKQGIRRNSEIVITPQKRTTRSQFEQDYFTEDDISLDLYGRRK